MAQELLAAAKSPEQAIERTKRPTEALAGVMTSGQSGGSVKASVRKSKTQMKLQKMRKVRLQLESTD